MQEHASEGDHNIILEDGDFIPFEDLRDNIQYLAYLKHVELPRLTPANFGLDKWTRMFLIPDSLMRRIYRHDAYKDTEKVVQTNQEKLSDNQRQILHNWLSNESPFKERDTLENHQEGRKTRSRFCEDDDLKDILDDSDIWMNQTEECCDIFDNTNIASCSGHRIQPESAIVEKAIDKMNHLSEEEEKRFQNLLHDHEFMEFLNSHIKKYLDNCE